jgi:integrase
VKCRAAAAGVGIADVSGHSLRAGFITEALNAGATPMEVMRQSLHKSESTILVYDRENNPLKRNAVTQVRL